MGAKQLKGSGMSDEEAAALLLATTSSQSGWAHAPTRAQSIVEWETLLRSFGVGLESDGGAPPPRLAARPCSTRPSRADGDVSSCARLILVMSSCVDAWL